MGQVESGVKVMDDTVTYSKCMGCKYVFMLPAEYGADVNKSISGS